MTSPWTPIAAMWLALFLTATATAAYPAAWLALASFGLAVLAAVSERLQRRELHTVHSINQILTAQVRHYERDRP